MAKKVVNLGQLPAHQAGIRVCVNLVENYALQAYWRQGDRKYREIVDILKECVDKLNTMVSPKRNGRFVRTSAGPDQCPVGTHQVDRMCVPD